MKKKNEEIHKDFKSGKLSWNDIDVGKIAEIGLKAVESFAKDFADGMINIGNKIVDEINEDLDALKKVGNHVENFFGSIFGRP